MPEWIAIAACVGAGLLCVVAVFVSQVLSRAKLAWLPGFDRKNRGNVKMTVGVRRSATQVYAYFFFAISLAAASHAAARRGTASYGLSPGAAAGSAPLPADENIYPLLMVVLLPLVSLASARTLLVVESGALDVLLPAFLNGLFLFILAQVSDASSAAYAFLNAFYWATNFATPAIIWQLSTTVFSYMHGAALALPVALSTSVWALTTFTYSTDLFTVHGAFYFWFPFVCQAMGLVGLAVVFLASARSVPRKGAEVLGDEHAKRPDHHHYQ